MAILILLKDALWKFFEDDAITLAGSVAYFTALALAPLLVILIGVAGLFGDQIHTRLINEITELAGPTAGGAVDLVVQHASEHKITGGISALIGLITLLFSATGVFVQLQKAMNRIWGIESEPGREIKEFFRKRLVSLGMVFSVGFLLLVSLAVSAVLSSFLSGESGIWGWIDFAVSTFVYFLAFGWILQYLPDVKIAWRDIAIGALITSVLFNIGKTLVGEYLGKSSIGSAYGAAGSLVILLVWVYYSSIIVFYGTEIASIYTERFGNKIKPSDIARWRDSFKRKDDSGKTKEKRDSESETDT